MTRKIHAVLKSGFMSQPAEGFYVDCRCGRTGGLKRTRLEAQEDHRKHVQSEEETQ